MKKFKDYDETKTYTEKEKLPKDAYVLKVVNASEVIYSWGSVLKIDFDIAEGEQAGFYKKDYDNQLQEDKKWKGSFRLPVPKDDGSEKDAWTKSRFKTAMENFEKSNSGFKWDWDEAKLVNKLIGGLFNLKEWEMNDKSGWYTQCKKLTSVENIRSGKFILPDDDPLKEKSEQGSKNDGHFMDLPEDNCEEIPFN